MHQRTESVVFLGQTSQFQPFTGEENSQIFYSSTGIFLGMIWSQITAPSQFTNEQNFKKCCFLVLHCGENFMKIRAKITKLQIHENLHKNVNENMYSFTFLCKFS